MTLDADITLAQGGFNLRVTFSAPPGITALFGPSGSGKSTLLAALAGLKKSRGHVRFNGRDLGGLAPHRRGIGMVFQDARLFPHLTVRANIAYAWKRAPRHLASGLEELARFFDMESYLDRPVHNLSGGEKSRVALARALASAPDVLLLDEPFAALDGVRRHAFIGVLSRLHIHYGIPMIVVSHDIEDAAALATHLVAIDAGKMVIQGAFPDASRDPAFQRLLDRRDRGTAIAVGALHSAREAVERALWLRADHVLLAAAPPPAISARNVLEGIVQTITPEGDSRLVTVHTGIGSLLARLTPEAVAELDLTPGCRAWAIVKAHTF